MARYYLLDHNMPSLGSPSAGCSRTFDNEDGLLEDVRQTLSLLKPGERLVIELEGDAGHEVLAAAMQASVRCPSCGWTGEPEEFMVKRGCPTCGKDRVETIGCL